MTKSKDGMSAVPPDGAADDEVFAVFLSEPGLPPHEGREAAEALGRQIAQLAERCHCREVWLLFDGARPEGKADADAVAAAMAGQKLRVVVSELAGFCAQDGVLGKRFVHAALVGRKPETPLFKAFAEGGCLSFWYGGFGGDDTFYRQQDFAFGAGMSHWEEFAGFEEVRTRLVLMERWLRTARREGEAPRILTLFGENGVGKSHTARLLAERAGMAFTSVNCAALQNNAIDVQLFGVPKGTFTGVAEQEGLLAQEKGVLFLDEVGQLPLETQGRLLTLLDSGAFTRFADPKGERRTFSGVLVFGTNKDLRRAVREETFLFDLYCRISGFTVTLPTFAERMAREKDFLTRQMAEFAEVRRLTLSNAARRRFAELAGSKRWSGNFREFTWYWDRAAALCEAKGHPGLCDAETIGQIFALHDADFPDLLSPLGDQPLPETAPDYKRGRSAMERHIVDFLVGLSRRYPTCAQAARAFWQGAEHPPKNLQDSFTSFLHSHGFKWDRQGFGPLDSPSQTRRATRMVGEK